MPGLCFSKSAVGGGSYSCQSAKGKKIDKKFFIGTYSLYIYPDKSIMKGGSCMMSYARTSMDSGGWKHLVWLWRHLDCGFESVFHDILTESVIVAQTKP